MSSIRDELYQLVESLPDGDLSQVLDFVRVLVAEPEKLTEKERRVVRKGEEEVRRGEWVKWEDIRRDDV